MCTVEVLRGGGCGSRSRWCWGGRACTANSKGCGQYEKNNSQHNLATIDHHPSPMKINWTYHFTQSWSSIFWVFSEHFRTTSLKRNDIIYAIVAQQFALVVVVWRAASLLKLDLLRQQTA
jgi:hypothetical protein